MLYMYGKGPTSKELAKLLGAKRIKPGSRMRMSTPAHGFDPDEDVIINYGYAFPSDTTFQLNRAIIGNKEKELTRLQMGGIPTPRFVSEGGLWRSAHHVGANDLLTGSGHDFMVERLDLIKEYRFHIFRFPESGALSVRAGTKIHRIGFPNPHPWIRSHASGWMIDYGTPPDIARRASRALAKRALEVVGYDFGAIDIGITTERIPVVLEVNAGPGLEGNSLTIYADNMVKLLKEKGYVT